MSKQFDTIIVITPADFKRLQSCYSHLMTCISSKKIIFIGSAEIEGLLSEINLGDRASFINENTILSFDDVYNSISDYLADTLNGQVLSRKAVGWYYQQFIKMKYFEFSESEYYMSWDGDTIPCVPFSMFKEGTDIPYMDIKHEYHEEYFNTLSTLIPGFKKCIQPSFISEHMLFNTEIMKSLINRIMMNTNIPGNTFYEKIIHSIAKDKVLSNSFSEFETYGTYVCYTNPSAYALRDWHSFRLGGDFFDPNKISESDYTWLGKDFFAISFEKGHSVRDDHANLFDNPEYQNKMSAKQMLQIAQEEFQDGYIEKWADNANQGFKHPQSTNHDELKKSLLEDTDFLGELADNLLKICKVYGPKDRVHISENTGLCNTLFNTISGNIYIGDYTFCGHNVSIISGTHDSTKINAARQKFPISGNDIHIGNGVWICSNATILGPCTIGNNAVIAAGSTVLPGTQIGSNELWAGTPATFKKIINTH